MPGGATSAARHETSGALVPLLDVRERVLPARERAADLRRVALLELGVDVGRLVGRDRTRQARNGDGRRRERGDDAARLALLRPVRCTAGSRSRCSTSAAEPAAVPPPILPPLNPVAAVERRGDVRDQLRARIVRAADREARDRAVILHGREGGVGVTPGDVDLEAAVDDADLVGRVDDAARAQRDRAGQIRVARRRARVLAVGDDDRLAVGRRARSRRRARRRPP